MCTSLNTAGVIWHRCEPVAADLWRTVSVRQKYCVEHWNQLLSQYLVGLLPTKYVIEYKLSFSLIIHYTNSTSSSMQHFIHQPLSCTTDIGKRALSRTAPLYRIPRSFCIVLIARQHSDTRNCGNSGQLFVQDPLLLCRNDWSLSWTLFTAVT